ncbi:unnamed protein product [Medioppia subpectinata]|uniref:Ig-like domain-containing protein n=1 Tax=Medioppia subpectinata TaxID=1979941 RepID=A0A7R9KC73_9ACAR|nr:unnamed protein product [Medioppia subpectinata]CAG2100702.1 unnamed protein product [Medioppia subpectinata]
MMSAVERHGPYFTREPNHTNDFSNSTGAVIYCSANGNPMPSIRWETKDAIVVNEISGVRHIRHDNSLVFPPFRAEDYRQDIHSNIYQCIASNSVGTIRSRYVQVRAVNECEEEVDE